MLENKVIVVTGGCGLLGRQFCTRLMSEDAIVIIADVDVKVGQSLASCLNKTRESCCKGYAEFVELDICNKTAINNAIDLLDEKYQRIDAIVNNAYPRNKHYGQPFFDVEFSDFCENINLNLGGYFLCSQQFAQYFTKQQHGNIINISSIYGVVAPDFNLYKGTDMTMPVEYAAIKSALIHLTKYMARYLKNQGIRVNCLSPGGILDTQPDTFLNNYSERTINKGMLEPHDISGTLVYLLSDASKYVNGQNIIVDDGFTA